MHNYILTKCREQPDENDIYSHAEVYSQQLYRNTFYNCYDVQYICRSPPLCQPYTYSGTVAYSEEGLSAFQAVH